MSRRPAAAAALAGTVAALTALATLACGGGGGDGGGPQPTGAAASAPPVMLAVEIYFPANDGLLHPERREVTVSDDAEAQIRAVVAELLAGPRTPGLVRPFPEGVDLAEVHLGADGVAFVDLASPAGDDPPAGGSALEMQSVYSVVDTVALNVAGARRVVLLWNGRQRESFAGHLDTSRPLAPAPGLVAR